MNIMISKLNSPVNTLISGTTFLGGWEDVSEYTTIELTGKFTSNIIGTTKTTSATITVEWASGNTYPNAPSTQTSIIPVKKKTTFNNQIIVMNRWFRVRVLGSDADTYLTMCTLHKKVQRSQFVIYDSSANVPVSTIQTFQTNDMCINSLYTYPVDISGVPLASTISHDNCNNALCITLTDTDSRPLNTDSSMFKRVSSAATFGDAGGTQAQVSQIEEPNPAFPKGRYAVWLRFLDTTAPNDIQSTMNITENTFRIPKNQAVFTEGDTVHFLMLNNNTAPTELSPRSVFTINDTTGYLHITGVVSVVRTDATHVTFRLLVDTDTGEWFTEWIQLNSTINLLPNFCTKVAGSTNYYKLNYSYGTPTAVPTVVNYYSVISQMRYLNNQYVYIGPGNIPLDLRFYLGSRGPTSSSTNTFVSQFELAVPSISSTRLLMTLKDSTGGDLTRTKIAFEYGYAYASSVISSMKLAVVVNGSATDGFTLENFRYIVNVYSGWESADLFETLVYRLNQNVPKVFNQSSSPYTVTAGVWNNTTYSEYYSTGQLTTPVDFTGTNTGSNSPWSILKTYVTSTVFPSFTNATTILIILSSGRSSAADQDAKETVIKNYAKLIGKRIFVLAPVPNLSTTDGRAEWTNILELAGGASNVRTYSDFGNLCFDIIDLVVNDLIYSKIVSNSSLNVTPVNSQGLFQGSVPMRNETGELLNNISAFKYTLCDNAGNPIDTTKTNYTDPNCLYTSLCTSAGVPLVDNSTNRLPVTITTRSGIPFNKALGTVNPVPVVANNSLKLNTLFLTNLTTSTIWVKLYDVSSGIASSGTYNSLSSYIVLNIAVPASNIRDINLSNSVSFKNGLYLTASSNPSYTVSSFPVSTSITNYVIVNGSYT